ncbi:hypothetical protein GH714_035273 [Hevea brasiliensis]|uniref:Uncharacterized protein n=1 Tax=Hevea brasiliensis TaxID=3981 RepID=A0A6A6KC17_HEVBR|nr:hypothetical protein GH714_035273 [Hevea brasiliensis]
MAASILSYSGLRKMKGLGVLGYVHCHDSQAIGWRIVNGFKDLKVLNGPCDMPIPMEMGQCSDGHKKCPFSNNGEEDEANALALLKSKKRPRIGLVQSSKKNMLVDVDVLASFKGVIYDSEHGISTTLAVGPSSQAC